MIFVTVGNMDPFDRLIQSIDQWLATRSGYDYVFAQIGGGMYQPKHCEFTPFLTPVEYRTRFEQSRLIVSHAGMGTIITALELQKPIIVMPKRATLGEQRNEHQLATVRHFQRSQQVLVADTEDALPELLEATLAAGLGDGTVNGPGQLAKQWPADPELLSFVRAFVS